MRRGLIYTLSKCWLILSFLCNLYQLYHSPMSLSLNHWYVLKTLIIGNYVYLSLRNNLDIKHKKSYLVRGLTRM